MSLSVRIITSYRLACTAAMLGLAATSFSQSPRATVAVPQLLPSTTKPVAGGGATTPASGGTCPVSGYTATDAYGDGCLATEVLLGTSASAPGPRAAVADALGNVYFGDYANGVVHRIDVLTGVMTAVVGGKTTSPGTGATCGSNISTDTKGDGCLASLVHLSKPTGIIFSPAGDLYVADYGYANVRKVNMSNQSVIAVIIASGGSGYTTAPTVTFSAPGGTGTTATGTATVTGGIVTGVTITSAGSGYTATPTVTIAPPTTGTTATAVAVSTGIITNAAGTTTGTYGYNASNATTTVTIAQSVLDGPYGLAFDSKGDLFVEDEYEAAVLVVNTSANTNTVNNTVIPAGTVSKIAGTLNGAPYCTNSNTSSAGCTYNHTYTEGIQANIDYLRNAYGLALDTLGDVFITNEYYDSIQKVAPSGLLTTAVGVQNSPGHSLTRGVAPQITIGSPFGVTTDSYNNLYFTDAADGAIWRVDANTNDQFVIGTGFGKSGTGFASTTLPGPGIFHISVDPYADLFFGDTENNVVTEIASGTQFGVIGANQPTDNVVIHFGVGDLPASAGAFTLTSGANNFSLGTPTLLASNADGTTDYTLPITATPSVLGRFTGNLQVVSQLGGTSNFLLSGYYVQSPVTRTSLTYTASVSCTGTTTYSTTTPVTLTATVAANGPNPPTGSADIVTFFAKNGANPAVTLGTAQVKNTGTSSAPVYTASLTYTFTTVGTYTLSATFSGDSYYHTSTGTAAKTITAALPSFVLTPVSYMESSVVPGQTALYSFTVAQSVYTGTIAFIVSGLPANSSYTLSPSTGLTGAGCSVTNTVALSILTQKQTTVQPGGFGGTGHGPWQIVTMLTGLGLALLVGLRRRNLSAGLRNIAMAFALLLITTGTVACGKGVGTVIQPATPAGSYTITVTPLASNGSASAITFPLIVQ